MNFGLEKLIAKHAGRWVAFEPKSSKIIAISSSAKKSLMVAQKKGVKIPILFKVPVELSPFVG